MRKTYYFFGALVFALIFVSSLGCGGGGSTASADSQSVPASLGGIADVRASGPLKSSPTVSGYNVTVAGLSGSQISGVTLNPAPRLSDTSIYYNLYGQIWAYSLATKESRPVSHSELSMSYPAVSKLGLLACVGNDASDHPKIYTMNLDGSGMKLITTKTSIGPAWSPNGNLLAYFDLETGALMVCNASGTGKKTLYTPPAGVQFTDKAPCWSPDGTRIGASLSQPGTGMSYPVQISYPDGAVFNFPTVTPQKGLGHLSWSPDGQSIVCNFLTDDNYEAVAKFGVSSGFWIPMTAAGTYELFPTFGPDGQSIVFCSFDLGLVRETFDGLNPEIIVPPSWSNVGFPIAPFAPAWSPYLPSKSFVGTAGTLGTASSGILLSQTGGFDGSGGFASLLSFSTQTASTATIEMDESFGGGPIVATLKGDNISQISWVNGYFEAKTAIAPTSTTTQCLVTIGGDTGRVTMVATARGPIKSDRDKRGRSPAEATYSGDFEAVYDGSGKNLAPNGAKQVQTNSSGQPVVLN